MKKDCSTYCHNFWDVDVPGKVCIECGDSGKDWQMITRADQIRQMDDHTLAIFLRHFALVMDKERATYDAIREELSKTPLFMCDGKVDSCGKDICYLKGGECHLTSDYEYALKKDLPLANPF